MYLSWILSVSLRAYAIAGVEGCWTAAINVQVKGEPAPRARLISLIFSGRRDYANALLIKDGAREYVTDFDCGSDLACTLLDDGGAFRLARSGPSVRASFGKTLDVDARESVRYARITNEGFVQVVEPKALPPPACAKEQARVRALFDAADRDLGEP